MRRRVFDRGHLVGIQRKMRRLQKSQCLSRGVREEDSCDNLLEVGATREKERLSAWYSVNQETTWEVVSLLSGKIMGCRQVLTTEHISKATRHKIKYLREISGYEKCDNIVSIAEIHGLIVVSAIENLK